MYVNTIRLRIVVKLLGESWYMSFAFGVTALFGFPGTLIIPTEVANAVGENEAVTEMFKKNLVPKIIIAVMVSVSVVSVVFAGLMAAWA